MGVGGAADCASQARRQQAHGRCARGGQWPDVCAEYRLPMASDPEGPAAAQHGACGRGTARSIASITRSMYNVVSWPTENPARAPPSSTVKASRARKKGGVD